MSIIQWIALILLILIALGLLAIWVIGEDVTRG